MTRKSSAWNAIAVVVCTGAVTVIVARASDTAPRGQNQSLPSTPERLSEMRHHFGDVLLVHEAVIRGDLPAVRAPAMRVAAVAVPTSVPETATSFVLALREAGQLAVRATSLYEAANATVAMVTQCAQCHRTVGVFPAVSARRPPDIGGVLGHMMEHQLATDDLLVGFMVPSPSQWRTGAERLRVAPLRPGEVPRDPKMTTWRREADVRLREIAERASAAETTDDRASAYAEIITTCSQCHGLHSTVWGPGRGGR